MSQKKSSLRAAATAVALEPRLLFDGAGAVATADAMDGGEQNQSDHAPAAYRAPAAAPMSLGVSGAGEVSALGPQVEEGAEPLATPVVGEDDAANVLADWVITGDGTVSVTIAAPNSTLDGQTFTGTVEAANAWLQGLSFAYTGDSEEGDSVTVTITVDSTSADGQANAAVVETLEIKVSPQNDPMTTTPGKVIAQVPEGSGSFTFDGADPHANGLGFVHGQWGISDVDNSADQVVIKLETVPDASYGELVLTRNGQEIVLSAGSTFSVAELGNLKYVLKNQQITSDTPEQSFRFTIKDGAGGVLSAQEVVIELLPVNDLPTVGGSVTIIEGEGPVSLGQGGQLPLLGGNRGEVTGVDPDGDELSYRVTSLPPVGALFYDGVELTADNISDILITDLTLLTYQYPEGADPKVTGKAFSFGIKAWDHQGENSAQSGTVTLNILDNNNDPVLEHNEPQRLESGSALTITPDMLQVSDSDALSDAGIFFNVNGVPDPNKGYFALKSIDDNGQEVLLRLVEGSSFTMQDVVDGRLVYVNRSTDATERTDSLSFTVTDSYKTLIFGDNAHVRDGGIYENGVLKEHHFDVTVPAGTGAGPGYSDLPEELPPSSPLQNSHLHDVYEGGSKALTPGELLFDDGKSAPKDIIYRVTALPAHGQLMLNGEPLGLYQSFTQDDVNEGRVTYEHGGSENFTDRFSFSVSNGSKVTSDFSTDVRIIPQNDSPTASGGNVVVTEGEQVQLSKDDIELSDSDRPGSFSPLPGNPLEQDNQQYAESNGLTFVVNKLPQHGYLEALVDGQWVRLGDASQRDAEGNLLVADKANVALTSADQLRYTHDGSENFSDSFEVTPSDDRGVLVTGGQNQASQGEPATVNIRINSVNDEPTLEQKDELTGDSSLYEGGVAIIYGDSSKIPPGAAEPYGQLIYHDPDNNTKQIQYRVLEAPKYGQLLLNGKPLGQGSVFTQADLDSGRLVYKHNGTDDHADSFRYQVSDADFIADDNHADYEQSDALTSTFNISVKPTNDSPTIIGKPSGPVVVDGTNPGHNSAAGFVISDRDLAQMQNGEVDLLTVIVRVTDKDGKPLTGLDYQLTLGSAVGITGATSTSEDQRFLQLTGSLSDINNALNSLQVAFQSDHDAVYQLQVIVDDRLNAAGTAYQNGGAGVTANGGERNELVGGNGPINDVVYDWNTAIVPATVVPNLAVSSVALWVSTVNDEPILTVPPSLTVSEDVASKITDIVVTDAESSVFDTEVEVVLSVGAGTLDVKGAEGVTVEGNGTGTVTLKGTTEQINKLLSNTDASKGVFYKNVSDLNHDQNGAAAGDVTLTVTLKEGASAIGGDVGQGSVAHPDIVKTIGITIEAVNDKPVVNTGTGQIVLGSEGSVSVSGITLTDRDANDGYASGESDGILELTVRLLDSNGQPLTREAYEKLGLSIGSGSMGGITVDGTDNGENKALVVRGTLADLQRFVAALELSLTEGTDTNTNADAAYKLEVILDDRLRDAQSGALLGGANGGAQNQEANLPEVPSKDTFNIYGDKVAAYGVFNLGSATRDLFVSTVNDPGTITGQNVTVNEGSNSLVLDAGNAGLQIDDPDHNGSTAMEVTISVDNGMVISGVGGAGGTISGLGTNTITISGASLAEINSRLQALTITFPDKDGSGPATAADWNGSFNVKVIYNDKGNTGSRPGSLPGDTDAPGANPGDFDYADGTSNHLMTTRVITVTVSGSNDAPLRSDDQPVILESTTEDTNGGAGQTVGDLFADKFSDARDDFTAQGGSGPDSFAGIAISGNAADPQQGTWQYSTDGGNTWLDVPTNVSATSALVLDADAKLRFNPAADFHGTPGDLTVRLAETAQDQNGNPIALPNGTRTDVSAADGRYSHADQAVTLQTTVSSVNDRPVGQDTTLPSINEDERNASGTPIGSLDFQYSDSRDDQTAITGGGNSSSDFGGLAIVGNGADPLTEGVWQYNSGNGWVDVGTPSAGAALILPTDAQLRFVPVADFNGTPGSLSVLLADTAQSFSASTDLSNAQGQTSTWSEPVEIGITVNPQNDAPSFSHESNNSTFDEATGTPVPLLGSGQVTDIDVGGGLPVFGAGQVVVSLTDPVAGDVLALPNAMPGVKDVTYDPQTGRLVINFSDTATPQQVADVLAAITYAHTGDDPTQVHGTPRTEVEFTVTLSDGNNVQGSQNAGGPEPLSSSKTGSITLVPENDPPVARPDTNAVREDSKYPATGNLITGDRESLGTDIGAQPSPPGDSDPDTPLEDLTITQVTVDGVDYPIPATGTVEVPGQYGTLIISANGDYTYKLDNANRDVNGLVDGRGLQDQFSYTLSDGSLSDSSTLTIEIEGRTDENPMLDPQTIRGEVWEQGLTGEATGSTPKVSTGVIDIVADGGLSSVKIGDTTLTLTDLEGLGEDSPIRIPMANGELLLSGFTLTENPDGSVSAQIDWQYSLTDAQDTPNADRGTDAVTIVVTDAQSVPQTSTGNLIITIHDDVPTANPDTGSLQAGNDLTGSTSGNVLIQGVDGEQTDRQGADGATVQPGVIQGQYGTLTLQSDGRYSYTLDPNLVAQAPSTETLTEVFDYTLVDGDGDTSSSTLTLTITRPPVAVDDAVVTDEDTPVSGNVFGDNGSGLDSDPDGDPLTVTGFEYEGVHYPVGEPVPLGDTGTLTLNPDGSFTFVPADNWHGTVPPVVYTISDGNGGTDTATLTITVTSVNDVPVAEDDRFDVDEGKTLTGTLVGNDTPSGDGGNQWELVTPPANGQLTLNPDGTFSYTPNPGFYGAETFTYQIVDADGDTSTATVTINVARVDDWRPPVTQPPVTPPAIGGGLPTDPLPVAPWMGPQLSDQSVYFMYDAERHMAVLPNPMHPALFVSHEVRAAHGMRGEDDMRARGLPQLARAYDSRLSSRNLDLGMVPGQFVMSEVQNTQQLSNRLDSLVESRFSRINLSSDGLVGTPTLQQVDPQAMVPAVLRANSEQAVASVQSAPSFSDQLREASGRLPLASMLNPVLDFVE